MNKIGVHYIVEFYGVHPEALSDSSIIRFTFEDAIKEANMTLLSMSNHDFPAINGNKYGGATVVAVLAESHMSLHGYPELKYAAIDIFTCGDTAKPELALEVLVEAFQPTTYNVNVLSRG